MSNKSSTVPWNHRRAVLASKVRELEKVMLAHENGLRYGDLLLQIICKHLKLEEDEINKIAAELKKPVKKKKK